jgi:hypothetical protein
MEINFNADPEFRKMVAAEVRATLIAQTRSELEDSVKEACRRTTGASMEKVPSIVTNLVKDRVRLEISNNSIHEMVRMEIRKTIEVSVKTIIQQAIQDQIDPAKIKKMISDRLDKVRLEIIL